MSYLHNTNQDLIFRAAGNDLDTNQIVNLGEWQHVTLSYDPEENIKKVFVNGRLIESLEALGTINPITWLSIGYDYNNASPTDHFIGLIDEVKIYNTALTTEQIIQDMNVSSGVSFGGAAGGNREADDLSDGAGADPVLYLDFNENKAQTANDKSGNNNTGTLTNGDWSVGRYGSGISAQENGVMDQVIVNDPADGGLDFSNSDSFTYSMWLNLESSNATPGFPFKKGGINPSEAGYSLWVPRPSAGAFACTYSDGDGVGIDQAVGPATSPYFNQEWFHVSCVMDRVAGEFRLYIDGKLVGIDTTLTEADGTNSQALRLGEDHLSREFNGKLDEVKIWNYARTPAQIAYDYNRGKPIAHWRMDECQGTTIHDSSGHDLHGTLTITTNGGNNAGVGTCQSDNDSAWSQGEQGKQSASLYFDGDGDSISLGNESSFNFDNQSFSVCAWTKTTANVGNSIRGIVGKAAEFDQPGFQLRMQGGTGHTAGFSVNDGINSSSVTGGVALNDGQWRMSCGVYNEATDQISLYVDGAIASVSSTPGLGDLSTSNNFTIGSLDGVRHFPGQIDDVKVWNYALSSAQVKNAYNDGAIKFGP